MCTLGIDIDERCSIFFLRIKDQGGMGHLQLNGVPYLHYYAKKSLSSKTGIFSQNTRKQKPSNMHTSNVCTVDLKKNNFLSGKL